MPRGDSSLNMLIVAAILALGVGYYVPQTFSAKPASTAPSRRPTPARAMARPSRRRRPRPTGRPRRRAASSRLAARCASARRCRAAIAEVLVALNDKVVAGDLLVRLDDEELIGRVNAALAEATVRKRERDNAEMSAGKPAQDRRSAEDSVASAERQLVQSREEFDRAYKARRGAARPQPMPTSRRRAMP